MKQFFIFIMFIGVISTTMAQVPVPKRIGSESESGANNSGATWLKLVGENYTLYDTRGNKVLNTLGLKYLSTNTLAVKDIDAGKIYLLEDFKNASTGTKGKARLLASNITKDFYLTNENAFAFYLDNTFRVGNFVNVNGSYVYYLPETDRTYYLPDIRKFPSWGAQNARTLDYSETNTYWYRTSTTEFGVIEKGEAINYSIATTEREGDNLIVLMDGVKTYILPNYYSTMSLFVFKPVKMYSGSGSTTTTTTTPTSTTSTCEGDCKDGWGKYTYDNGYYSGFWKDGLKHGYGMYKWDASGGKYIGQWENDKMTGYGVYIAKNKDNIIGEFVDGKLNGLGITVTGDDWEQGVFKDGVLVTSYPFVSTGKKIGCTAGDCQEKYGRYVWGGGDSFTGFWKNGKMYMGTYKFANGDIYSGYFNRSNQLHGFGRYFYDSGSYYGGEWDDGEQQGRGYFHNKDYKQQIGIWDAGKLIKSLKKE